MKTLYFPSYTKTLVHWGAIDVDNHKAAHLLLYYLYSFGSSNVRAWFYTEQIVFLVLISKEIIKT